MRGKNSANINISLVDFGASRSARMPSWLSKDSSNDLLAMSLLQGDLDHFVINFLNNESGWKKWFTNPLGEEMPQVELELEKSSK